MSSTPARRLKKKISKNEEAMAVGTVAYEKGVQDGRAQALQLVTVIRRVTQLFFGSSVPQELLELVDTNLRAGIPRDWEAADAIITETVHTFRMEQLRAHAPAGTDPVTGMVLRAGVHHGK